jgi:N-acetylglucosaminyldiphosphoundecaprenol N-acetyl-beta-D-mannosaminyltransferase
VEVLGVRLDDVTYVDALSLCAEFIAEGGPHLVATVNTEFVMAAQKDGDYRRTLNRAALCVPDGVGLLLAARLVGHPLRQHVRGTDLVDNLASLAAIQGYRLFLLGGWQGVAVEAGAALQRRWPGLQIAGWYEGTPDPAHDSETVAAVKAAGPVDIVLVAYGAPAQERWIERNLGATGAAVGIGVGGVFSFFAGRAPRAPLWVQRLELEWLYRLLTQPWRWRRQLALPRFVLLCLAHLLAGRPIARELGARPASGGQDHQPHGDGAQ